MSLENKFVADWCGTEIGVIDMNFFSTYDTASLREVWILYTYNNSIPDNPFSKLKHLEQLHLYSNQIEKLDSMSFNGLISLKKLFIQNNQLRNIQSNTFDYLKNLEELDLHGNEIKYLD
jgi:Leucine-rich repeat (LRR) protein